MVGQLFNFQEIVQILINQQIKFQIEVQIHIQTNKTEKQSNVVGVQVPVQTIHSKTKPNKKSQSK